MEVNMYLCTNCGAKFDDPIDVLKDEYPAYNNEGDLLGLEQEYACECPTCGSCYIEEI